MASPRGILVAGPSGSGKTLLLEQLAQHLPAACIIKWTHHPPEPDRPNSDTGRLGRAGRSPTILAHADGMVFRGPVDAASLYRGVCAGFPDAQWVLIEGGKHQPFPKVYLDPEPFGDVEVSPVALLLSPHPPRIPTVWEPTAIPLNPETAKSAAHHILGQLDTLAFNLAGRSEP